MMRFILAGGAVPDGASRAERRMPHPVSILDFVVIGGAISWARINPIDGISAFWELIKNASLIVTEIDRAIRARKLSADIPRVISSGWI